MKCHRFAVHQSVCLFSVGQSVKERNKSMTSTLSLIDLSTRSRPFRHGVVLLDRAPLLSWMATPQYVNIFLISLDHLWGD